MRLKEFSNDDGLHAHPTVFYTKNIRTAVAYIAARTGFAPDDIREELDLTGSFDTSEQFFELVED